MKDKLEIKLDRPQMVTVQTLLKQAILRTQPQDRSNRELLLLMATLNEAMLLITTKLLHARTNYKLRLTVPLAQAILVAFDQGYLYAEPHDRYAAITLTYITHQIDKQT